MKKRLFLLIISMFCIFSLYSCESTTTNYYTVTFDSNGGNTISSQKVEEGKTANEVIPEKEGFEFVGWYESTTSSKAFSFQTPITKDMTLTARWNEILPSCTVTFDSKGGSKVEAEKVIKGNQATEVVPTLKGYSFEGWSIDGVSLYDFSTPVKSDFTLVALWKEVVYTITFYPHNQTTMEQQIIKENDLLVVEPITKEGYRFLGWFSDTSYEHEFDFTQPIQQDYSLYAKWERISYVSLVFTDEDDTVYYQSEKIESGTILSELSIDSPKKDNYRFDGWYLDSSLQEKATSSTSFTEDTTLFAKWVRVYVVTIYDETKTTVVSTQTINEGEKVQKPADLSKDGFRFVGWKDASNDETYDFTQTVTTTLSLYAVFKEIFTISFYDGTTLVSSVNVEEGESCPEPRGLDKDNYRFIGWRKDLTSSNNYLFKTPVTSSFSLYAKWLKECVVTFNTLGGSEVASQIVIENGYLTLPDAPSKEGEYFSGWYYDEEFKNPYSSTKAIVDNMTLYAKFIEGTNDFAGIINDYIPDEISANLVLPTTYAGASLSWSTSDSNTLTSTGEVNPAHKDLEVTVTLKVTFAGTVETYSKKTTVRKVNFAPLSIGTSVLGYASAWYFTGSFSKEVLETTDVIFYSFAYLYSNYSLDLSQNGFENKIPQVLKARQSGVRVVLSVQGYGSEGKTFSDACSTADGRKTLINNIVECVEKYHFDGIDIDWEYPGYQTGRDTAVDRVNYTAFVTELSNRFHGLDPDYLVTAAIPGGPWGYTRYELQKVGAALDYINLMTYDLTAGTTSTHHTALYQSSYTYNGCSGDETVKNFVSKGVPIEKLTLGCAFYGKYVTVTSTGNGSGLHGTVSGEYKTKAYTLIKSTYLDTTAKVSQYYHYDSVACAPYIYDAANNLFLTYDDPTSLKEKCSYVQKNKLGGIMIWELGEDKTNDLINAIASIKTSITKPTSITLSGQNVVEVGSTLALQLNVNPLGASDTCTYTSSNTNIATVSSKGVVTGVSSGKVTITATSTLDSSVSSSITITVNPKIQKYKVTLISSSSYASLDAIKQDLQKDYSAWSGKDSTLSDKWSDSVDDFFVSSEYHDKWVWLMKYFQTINSENSSYYQSMIDGTDLTGEFDPYVITFEVVGFMQNSKCSSQSLTNTTDFSTYNVNNILDYCQSKTEVLVEEGKTYVLPTLSKEGYTFDGWYISSDFSGASVTEVTQETTLYAKWK
jgi:uncharacterized repeat protein (TIGR02543 family)